MSSTDLFAEIQAESPAVRALNEARAAACCKGSVALGSGCGWCMRCKAAIADMEPPARVSQPAEVGTEIVMIRDENILALDLGNKCGWALCNRDGDVTFGTEVFTPRAHWTPGQRWQRFRVWLSQTIVNGKVHEIWFEKVVFGHSSASAADVYGGYRALVEMVADSHNLILKSVAVPTIKKHWTGYGFAKKPAMIAEAARRGYRIGKDQDNSADALAILDYARTQEF